MTDLLRTISAKFYQNWPGFVENTTKSIFGVFSFVHSVHTFTPS